MNSYVCAHCGQIYDPGYAHVCHASRLIAEAKAALIAWLDSDCTGHPVLLGFGSPRKRRKCELCWREFKESVK